jgi:thymidylate synthase, flavin-dependent
MEIKLLHYTPIEILGIATSMPYQSEPSAGLVKRTFNKGHRSVVRHGMAVFLIKDISQSLLRQISRHPHINLTVKSSRYCDMSNVGYNTPIQGLKDIWGINTDNIDEKFENIYEDYKSDMTLIMQIYRKWKAKEKGQKEVDVAKMFLPLASNTDIVLSGNYQALYEFLQLRNCERAETEIKHLSKQITKILADTVPEIFGDLDCRGKELGYCPEFKTCGKYKKRGE